MTSTIDIKQPAQGAPINSGPVRNNFTAAANDINGLQNLSLQLNGDVSGSTALVVFVGGTSLTVATTLANSGAVAGTYTNPSVTVDAKGRVTGISSGSTPGTGTVTSVGISGTDFSISNSPITASGNIALALATQGSLTASTYAGITVNAKGIVTTARALNLSDITSGLGYTPVSKSGDTVSGTLNIGAGANYVAILGATTGNPPSVAAQGSDINVGLNLTTQGTGILQFNGSTVLDTNKNLQIARFNSGTSASSTTFWRGDGTWAAPSGTGTGTVTSVGISGSDFSIGSSPVTTSGTITLALATQGSVTPGTYFGLTVSAKGLVTATAAPSSIAAVGSQNTITAAGSIAFSPVTITATGADASIGINLVTKGSGTVQANGTALLTANQSITLSGDATGSGTTAITATLATVNSNVGTFQGVTVNGKGLVTAAAAVIWSANIQVGAANGIAVANDTYYFTGYAPRAMTITSAVAYIVGSGTATVAIQINGVNVTSLSSLSATTSSTTPTSATGANSVSTSNPITAVVTASTIPAGSKLLVVLTVTG